MQCTVIAAQGVNLWPLVIQAAEGETACAHFIFCFRSFRKRMAPASNRAKTAAYTTNSRGLRPLLSQTCYISDLQETENK